MGTRSGPRILGRSIRQELTRAPAEVTDDRETVTFKRRPKAARRKAQDAPQAPEASKGAPKP